MRDHDELELLSAYVDGELDDVGVRAVEAHLPTCGDCRTMLQAIQATVADLALLEEPEVDPSISWSLRAEIARARRRPGRFTRAAMALSGVAAVAIAFVAFNNFTGREDASTGPGLAARAGSADAQALTEAASPPADVFAAGGNYDKESALTLLDPRLSSFGGDTTDDLGVDWTAVFSRCEPTVEKTADETYVLRTTIGSRFEDKPALLLVYDVGAGDNARRELWVLDAETCEVRFFAQD